MALGIILTETGTTYTAELPGIGLWHGVDFEKIATCLVLGHSLLYELSIFLISNPRGALAQFLPQCLQEVHGFCYYLE